MQRQLARASSGRYVSRLTGGTLAIIMAGGRGERLRDLTAHRCKPATPFGGKFRIIDFVLSNCVNSGIRQISILTQYKAQSLIQHVQHGWSYLRGEFGEFVEVVPAQQQLGGNWYREVNQYWDPPEGYTIVGLGLVDGDPAREVLTQAAIRTAAGPGAPLPTDAEWANARSLYAMLSGRISGFTGRHAYVPATGTYAVGSTPNKSGSGMV